MRGVCGGVDSAAGVAGWLCGVSPAAVGTRWMASTEVGRVIGAAVVSASGVIVSIGSEGAASAATMARWMVSAVGDGVWLGTAVSLVCSVGG